MKNANLFFLMCFISITACQEKKNSFSNDSSLEVQTFISLIEHDFQILEQEITQVGDFIKYLYSKKDSILANADRTKYKIKGHYANSSPNEDPKLSTLYLSIIDKDEQAAEELLLLTNPLDEVFRKVIQENGVISQVYFNSKVQFNRLFPPYDAATMLDPDLDLTSYNFYYEADEQNNPDRKLIWVKDIYVDPVGKGWVLSLLNPIYFENDLKMVLAFDISVNVILDNYLNKTNRQLVIIDREGTVVSGKSRAIGALSLPPLKNHTYLQTITADSFRPGDYNLFKSKSKEVRKMISHFQLSGGKNFVMNDGLEQFKVMAYQMNRMDWLILDLEI